MGRMSLEIKNKYSRLERPDGRPTCYYCGEHATMDDTTPSHKIPPDVMAGFPGDWTIARTCPRCWSKINNANLVRGARDYGVPAGCMTVEQKTGLLTGKDASLTSSFVRKEDGYYYPRGGFTLVDSNRPRPDFMYENRRFDCYEVEMLQPVMACILLNMERIGMQTMWLAMNGNVSYQPERFSDYMLFLNTTWTEGDIAHSGD
jgi:hypothetical protein